MTSESEVMDQVLRILYVARAEARLRTLSLRCTFCEFIGWDAESLAGHYKSVWHHRPKTRVVA